MFLSSYTRQMLSASRGKPEYLNNVYSLRMLDMIQIIIISTTMCFFFYAGSESVYGGADIEVVQTCSYMAAVRAGKLAISRK